MFAFRLSLILILSVYAGGVPVQADEFRPGGPPMRAGVIINTPARPVTDSLLAFAMRPVLPASTQAPDPAHAQVRLSLPDRLSTNDPSLEIKLDYGVPRFTQPIGMGLSEKEALRWVNGLPLETRQNAELFEEAYSYALIPTEWRGLGMTFQEAIEFGIDQTKKGREHFLEIQMAQSQKTRPRTIAQAMAESDTHPSPDSFSLETRLPNPTELRPNPLMAPPPKIEVSSELVADPWFGVGQVDRLKYSNGMVLEVGVFQSVYPPYYPWPYYGCGYWGWPARGCYPYYRHP